MRFIFSIIILTKDEEKTIGKLLFKLIKYTQNYSTEIIIIDSGSTDQTLKIVNNFIDTTNRKNLEVKLIRIKSDDFNFGGTRNLGVKIAKGKYICFISGDAIPLTPSFLARFEEDFAINKRVVAIFGKQIPYKNTSFFQQLEFSCRFDDLDKYRNSKTLLIQDRLNPFVSITKENKLIWYSIYNVFACYKKSFLLKNPFPITNYFEDFIIGKKIIEDGLIKIYDSSCLVIHSHNHNLFDYFRIQKKELAGRTEKLGISNKNNVFDKLKKILSLKSSFLLKLKYFCEFLLYYFIKLCAILSIKLG